MYLTREPTLNHDSQIFAISLRHMGATVLSKDEKEQRIYRVLLIGVPLYGRKEKKREDFLFFDLHAQTEKACAGRARTHAATAAANRFATLARPRTLSLSSMLTMLEWTGSRLPGSRKRVP